MHMTHNKNLGLLVIRIVTGIIFMVHGYAKFAGIGGTVGFFAMLGIPAFFVYVVAFVEFFGGLSLIIGYGSKVASALLACTMLVALIKVHGPRGFGNSELVLTLLATNLGIFFAGSGEYAVGSSCGCPTKEGTCPIDMKPKA
jgi:putative oxidoreductase